MIRTFLAFVFLVGLVSAALYFLAGQQQFTTSTNTNTRTIVDNHTIVTITNNVPPDYSSIALIILAVAVLLYVIFTVVLPSIREWRSSWYESET